MKVLSIVGARPQFVKAAVVSRALKIAGVAEYLVHTGQHYDPLMSDVFFSEMGMRSPDINLGVGSGLHGAQTAAMLEGLERVISAEKPRWVLVYGDTNSTLAGTLAAAKLNVPIAHVESGLRSYNRRMPEEINRIVADALSTILFIPTETAHRNLLREGVAESRITWTGDVMYDATLLLREKANGEPGVLGRLRLDGEAYVLATIHRAENTDDLPRLQTILDGFRAVAGQIRVVWPMHPRTRARLAAASESSFGAMEVIEPVGFLDMARLESGATVIATDSGGVQKEAFFHGVPCVTLREETEWTELVELGWNRIVPPIDPQTVARAILSARGTCGRPAFPYGDGHASERIVEALLSQKTCN